MKKRLMILIFGIYISSCGIDSDVLEYAKGNFTIDLEFPEKDSDCTEGIIVSETQSELIFRWIDENENGPYTVHLTNISNAQTELFESSTTEQAIILDRGAPYSWFVVGTSNNRSEIWNFYNEGPGVLSTIPLPAIAISPVSGATISQTSTTVNLIWRSEDEDDDIIGYDIYFGSIEDPPLLEADIATTRYNDIPVASGSTYYWKVITKDEVGNESTSPIFIFTVG